MVCDYPGRRIAAIAVAATLLTAPALRAEDSWSPWRYRQPIEVDEPGLMRLELPDQTIAVARPDLGDLRLLDEHGREIPYILQRPKGTRGRIVPAGAAEIRVLEHQTVVAVTTGTDLRDWPDELSDGELGQAGETSYEHVNPVGPVRFYRVREAAP